MQLENLHLRRIFWALEQPSFLNLPETVNYYRSEAHREEVHQTLLQLDQNQAAVNDFFENLGAMPMGRYFEQLIFFILDHDSEYEVLWQNKQIITDKGITIGELDLVLKNSEQVIEHWEIALKYYLQVKNSSDHRWYIGPSRKDFLAKKMRKLYDHQLALGKHSQVIEAFGSIPSKLFLKGELYFPIGDPERVFPESYQAKTRSYCSIAFKDLKSLSAEGSYFKILYKPDWIGKYESKKALTLLSFPQLKKALSAAFDQTFRPQLIAVIEANGPYFKEVNRYFILPQNWPGADWN